ncbi:MAG: kat [Verrucomicrobiales bacterium]|nr:kat [Verrucomicrobiales bacterium]
MKFWTEPSPADTRLIDQLAEFLPDQIFDIHSHLFHPQHCLPGHLPGAFDATTQWDVDSYFAAMKNRLPNRRVDGLFFGYPSRLVDHAAANAWVAQEVLGRFPNRALAIASPSDSPDAVRELIAKEKFVGLKPYHVYANVPNTMHAKIEDFAPDWMWEICHEIGGVLMLHIVRDRAISDKENILSLQRLCRRYPNCRLVLAHIARSFNYRHALEGLAAIKNLPNAFVDTSLVTESEGMRAALQILGPERLLFGSDFPFSELRGKCTSVGDGFAWIYADELPANGISKVGDFTLLGIDSLLCLREACESVQLNQTEVRAIFRDNALRLLVSTRNA